jgi:hypothetical protein
MQTSNITKSQYLISSYPFDTFSRNYTGNLLRLFLYLMNLVETYASPLNNQGFQMNNRGDKRKKKNSRFENEQKIC